MAKKHSNRNAADVAPRKKEQQDVFNYWRDPRDAAAAREKFLAYCALLDRAAVFVSRFLAELLRADMLKFLFNSRDFHTRKMIDVETRGSCGRSPSGLHIGLHPHVQPFYCRPSIRGKTYPFNFGGRCIYSHRHRSSL